LGRDYDMLLVAWHQATPEQRHAARILLSLAPKRNLGERAAKRARMDQILAEWPQLADDPN
jgi:hypothetical protein